MGSCEVCEKKEKDKGDFSQSNILPNPFIIENSSEFYVKFISPDPYINTKIPCSRTDKFSKVKEKLFQKYPEVKYKNVAFIHCASRIKEFLTIGENNINNGDKILIIGKI